MDCRSWSSKGPKTPRQMLDRIVASTAEAVGKKSDAPPDRGRFAVDPNLIETGRRVLRPGMCLVPRREGGGRDDRFDRERKTAEGAADDRRLSLDALRRTALAAARSPVPPLPSIPEYDLSPSSGSPRGGPDAYAPAAGSAEPTAAEWSTGRLVAFNCYACHSRGSLGGPEMARNSHFKTGEPEMGDEGRIPPTASPASGDKLNDDWLREVTRNGAARPRIACGPGCRSSAERSATSTKILASLDRQPDGDVPGASTSPSTRSRRPAGSWSGRTKLACIKCHQFGALRATGIQAIDLQTMTRRLRTPTGSSGYLPDPQKYRPGTPDADRLPERQGDHSGRLRGNPPQQIAAIWTYLTDSTKAGIPDGLLAQSDRSSSRTDPLR